MIIKNCFSKAGLAGKTSYSFLKFSVKNLITEFFLIKVREQDPEEGEMDFTWFHENEQISHINIAEYVDVDAEVITSGLLSDQEINKNNH